MIADTLVVVGWTSAAVYAYQNASLLPTTWAQLLSSSVPIIALSVVLVLLTPIVILRILTLFLGIFYETNPLATTWQFISTMFSQESRRKVKVDSVIDKYNNLHKDTVEQRESQYRTLVDSYYELATQFYEWGWGQSFHFATRLAGESFYESIKRHEYVLAGRLNVSAGSKILDCGCGIGGPLRNITRFTQCDITGITLNEYQVIRGNQITKAMGLDSMCRSVQGDFMKLPFPDNHFDAVYAIEATCHAPDQVACFKEILRVLKPGGRFVSYEWCMTKDYDSSNAEHRRIKKMIEEGDGLPEMRTTDSVVDSMKKAGMKLVEARDLVDEKFVVVPWYQPLTPSYNILSQRFQFNPIGLVLTRIMLTIMEAFCIAPKGTRKVQEMLQQAAVGLALGGKIKIFTPMYLVVTEKPRN
eukprot:c11316_g1_i1.p1 GENE.c11316_g1_i1~~c11316_g1_i1.p1  ORF type:complete len:425 (+),score=107.41 c11316_g1_i1:35-1276(+)